MGEKAKLNMSKPKKLSKMDRLAFKLGIKAYENLGFVLDTFSFPVIKKQQDTFIRGCYRAANTMADLMGQPRKKYKRLKERDVIEVIE